MKKEMNYDMAFHDRLFLLVLYHEALRREKRFLEADRMKSQLESYGYEVMCRNGKTILKPLNDKDEIGKNFYLMEILNES